MQLIALRHGQSDYNVAGLCNDDPARAVDLTPLGVAQAIRAAEKLRHRRIDRAYCSPLLRARRTAEIAVSDRVDVVIEPRLADIRSGCEGLPVGDYLSAIAHDPVDARVGDGESLREYCARVSAFLVSLSGESCSTVLLVAHEETLRIVDAFCNKTPLAAVAGKAFANCEPYEFDLINGN